jgi:hypothetical protein
VIYVEESSGHVDQLIHLYLSVADALTIRLSDCFNLKDLRLFVKPHDKILKVVWTSLIWLSQKPPLDW